MPGILAALLLGSRRPEPDRRRGRRADDEPEAQRIAAGAAGAAAGGAGADLRRARHRAGDRAASRSRRRCICWRPSRCWPRRWRPGRWPPRCALVWSRTGSQRGLGLVSSLRLTAAFLPPGAPADALVRVAGALLCAAGLVGGLVLAPPDYQQGDGFRIIYVHAPAAWLSLHGLRGHGRQCGGRTDLAHERRATRWRPAARRSAPRLPRWHSRPACSGAGRCGALTGNGIRA